MQKPEPLKHAECEQCLETAPLLMPVPIAPGFALIVWPRLCMACRLNLRSDKYQMLGSDLMHSPHEQFRAAWPEWLAAEI